MEESCHDVADVDSDEGELWFSDDESAERDCAQNCFTFPWTGAGKFSCREDTIAPQALEKDLSVILVKVGIARDEVAAVYLLGPHLWGYASRSSSYKLLIIVKQAISADVKRGEKSKGARGNKTAGYSQDTQFCHRHQQNVYLDSASKKSSKHLSRQVKITLESAVAFENALSQHKELLSVWLSDEHIWLETSDLTAIRTGFSLNRAQLMKVVSSHCAFATKRFDKHVRKEDWSNARRVILKLFRVLLLSLQLARYGRIVNYSCQPELGRLADCFSTLEIMPLTDTRKSRMNASDSKDAELGEEHRMKTLWKNLCEPMIDKLRAACTCQIPVCKQDGDVAPTIPEAISEEVCQRLCQKFPLEEIVLQLLKLKDMYENTQNSCIEKHSSLKAKLSELKAAFATEDDHELLENKESVVMTELEIVDSDLRFLAEQLLVTQKNIDCVQAILAVKGNRPRAPTCIVDFLINIDDVKKHSAEKSIPDYYLDLVDIWARSEVMHALIPFGWTKVEKVACSTSRRTHASFTSTWVALYSLRRIETLKLASSGVTRPCRP
jgi:hypothetical protein